MSVVLKKCLRKNIRMDELISRPIGTVSQPARQISRKKERKKEICLLGVKMVTLHTDS